MFDAAMMSGMQANEKHKYTTQSTTEAKRAVRGYCIPIPPAIRAAMRHPPMSVPKGSLQICCTFCQVSESCHISAMTPNSTADAPNTIRAYHAVFIQKKQLRARFGPVTQARSFPLYLSSPWRRNAAYTNSLTTQWAGCAQSLNLHPLPPTNIVSGIFIGT